MRVSVRHAFTRTVAALVLSAGSIGPAWAQSASAVAATARIKAPVRMSDTSRLANHIPGWAIKENDLGELPQVRRLDNLHLILKRAPEVQAAFEQLLADQQDPASPRFHQWLTPAQNAERFGVAPSDLAAVTAWLQSQGLVVDDTAAGGVFLTFSGPVSAVETAFSTSLHNFAHEGVSRYAPMIEPSVPTALALVVQSVGGLAEMVAHPHMSTPRERVPVSAVYPDGDSARPLYTLTGSSGTVYHFLSPGDFSLIYDANSVAAAGITGTGSRVAILGGSRVQASDVTAYETLFSLPALQPTVVLLPTGTDPGNTGDGNEGEAILDVDRVLATAPGAGPDLLITKNALSFTLTFSLLQYNISTLNDPIQSLSFGACEYTSSSQTYARQFDSYFSTAAAQGIGTYISSGDQGAAGCDTGTSIPATQVLAPNLLCASTFATCVGGTEFADFTNPSLYWSSTNSTTKISALGYIPEGSWNEPTYTTTSGALAYEATGTGGGVSITIAKPSYQTGTGVPADGFRDTPDMSFASSTHNAYVLCFAAGGASCGSGGYVYPVGGTSAAAPSMAGVAALLNQKLGIRQGNLNPVFYRLAATPSNGVFHDITPATSGVTSCNVSVPSLCNNSTPSSTSLSGGLAGYALTTGYDQATGLGTLDIANFLTSAGIGTTPATLALSATPSPTTVGATTTLSATLTPSVNTPTPTGSVQFYSNGAAIGSPVMLRANTASLVYNFTTTGVVSVTAVYTGDVIFASETAPALSLEVDPAPFSVNLAPAYTSLTLVSGASTGNTVPLSVSSTSAFAGTVNLSCAVTPVSGTAGGSCVVAPGSVSLAAGSSVSTPVLTINSIAGTSGVLNVRVTGASGATNYTTAPIVVTLTAPGFTLTPAPSTTSVLAGGTAASTVTVTSANMFNGPVSLTCSAATATGTAQGTCTLAPASFQLSSGSTATSAVQVATTAGTSGTLNVTIKGSGFTSGATLPATALATVTVSVDTPRYTLAASPTALASLTAGATTGNTSTITLTSVNGYAGAVALTCSLALTSGGAVSNAPSCTLNPTSVSLASGGTQTTVATIGSSAGTTTGCTAELRPSRRSPEIVAFATLLLVFLPLRRRKVIRGIALGVSLLCGLASISGCGSGGGNQTASPCVSVVTGKTTSGAYTATVSGVSGSLTGSTTFTFTIN